MSDLELRTLPSSAELTPERTEWLQAVSLGFHDKALTDEQLARWNAEMHADGMRARGMYRASVPAGAFAGPVGTFMSYDALINTGPDGNGVGHLETGNLISDVTVRASHRRQGILRTMMTADLSEAHERGLAFASLTVTEAVIYGRFGFGVSSLHQHVELDVSHDFALRHRPGGHCEFLDASSEVVKDQRDRLFRQTLETTRGAHDRATQYRDRLAGDWDHEEGGKNRKLRTVGHWSDEGTLDGMATFEYGDWTDHDLRIHDLVALTPGAELALWDHLGHQDLVKRVTWRLSNQNSPLRWALVDSRRLEVKGLRDCTWLRVLDPVKALSVRGWQADGTAVLEIADDLGFAAGRFRVTVEGGRASVEKTKDEADVQLGVPELGSLYFGAVRPRSLAAAGRIGGNRDAIAALDRLFEVDDEVFNNSHF
ncbi:GNAT family N-acetyltransferase [Aestuariimicrobium soli]|uniref:GNAT family N-acetyltransferase n=1 Tax=Aestuariimicrobium soli TaxID=2035834 RepID=UPI003EB8B039